MTRRFALYFAPPEGSELETFGRSFLGRDHMTGAEIEPLRIEGLSTEEMRQITNSARHYGFHATLKAPFVLRDGCSVEDLRDAAEAFAEKRSAFEAPPLQVSALSRWIAFTLSADCPEMDLLATDCVRDFEPFRAALNEADIARRRESALTLRQDQQMLAFGYPYIFDDFHFHMTLAGPLEVDERTRLVRILRPVTSAIENAPLCVDAIALYEQPNRDSPFLQTGRYAFRSA